MAEQPSIVLGKATLEQMERQGFPRPAVPTMDLPNDRQRFWLSLIAEEYDELRGASERLDLLGFADALGDLVYVAYLTAWSHGIDLDRVIAEIHRSNLTKDPPLTEGDKSVKGAGFVAPDIAGALGLSTR